MSRRALVTGATGMLGSHIVERLLLEGWEVRALVRDPARAVWLQECGAELAVGRLEDGASLLGAAKGCDVIFHAAATIGAGGDWEAFRRGNVEGTRGVVDAATAAGARATAPGPARRSPAPARRRCARSAPRHPRRRLALRAPAPRRRAG